MRSDASKGRAEVVVELPTALTRLFPGSAERVELSAESVGELMDRLDIRWPGMRDRLCDSMPRIRRNINIFVDGRRASLDTRLPPGARVFITIATIG
jgi:hypothetical protein